MTTERESQREAPETSAGDAFATDFGALFEASPALLLVLAPPDFKIVAANQARLRATMTDRAAILGRPLFEIFPDDPDDPQANGVRNLEASLQRVLATRRSDAMPVQRYPIRRPAAQGGGFEERWWAPVNAPVLGPDGQVQLIIHQVEDVTETVRLRAAHDQLLRDQEAANQRLRENDAVLRRSEQRQRFLLKLGDRIRAESNPEAVIALASRELGEWINASRVVYAEIDEEAGLARVRQGWTADGAQVHPGQIKLSEFGGPLLDDLRAGATVRYDDVGTPPYARDDFAALAAIGIRAGVSVPLVVGDRLVVNLNVNQDHPRVWSDAEVELIEAVAERTWAAVERARAEARLIESEERYRSLFDQVVAGIAESDLTGRIITANERYCEMLGYSSDEVLGLNMQDITHPDDLPGNLEKFRRCREEGVPFEIEKRYFRKDGSTVWVHNSVSLVRDANGQPKSLVAAVLDIGERVRTEQALADANRAKDEFLAMLGHELRNPLSPIVTTLELMKLRSPDTLASERQVIEQQVRYISDMVDDLLDVARIARGKVELKNAPVPIAGIAAAAIETTRPLFEEREQMLHTAIVDGLVVFGDRRRLVQAVVNLLTNAAKYSPRGCAIYFSVAAEANEAVLRVRDQGIGIDPALLPRVFELFTQDDQSIERSRGGLGLGLAIVRNLIEMHGGSVSASSAGRDRGSEFVVRLPLLEQRVEAKSEPPPAAPVAGRVAPRGQSIKAPVKVLIVDDYVLAAESLSALLQELGFETHITHDGASALAAVAQFRPSVALVDIGLPVMDGYEVARRLRRTPGFEHLPLVALTGYGQESDRERVKQAGFDEHLIKPVDAERIGALIEKLVTA